MNTLYAIRNERSCSEELGDHLRECWSLGMDVLEPGFDSRTFVKNRQRRLRHEVTEWFFDAVVCEADRSGPLSEARFTVHGSLIEAAADLKRVRPSRLLNKPLRGCW